MGKQKKRLRNLARWVAFSTAGLSALRLIRAKGNSGAIIGVGKMTSTALAPSMKISGSVAAILAGLSGAPLAWAAGIAGAVLSGKHIDALNTPRRGCEKAFGEDWLTQIPEEREAKLRPYPTSPLLNHPGVTLQQDVIYATLENDNEPRDLLCDIWLPPDNVQRSGKAFIYLHGSMWHFIDKDVGTRPMFQNLTSLGHVCMDVSYRLCPEADWKGMLADTQRAVLWMKDHAEAYDIHPEHIILAGGSAGGQLALLHAYTAEDADFAMLDADADRGVSAVVAWYPVTDLTVFYEHAGKILGRKVKNEHDPLEQFGATLNEAFDLDMHLPAHWDADDTIIGAIMRSVTGGLPDQVPDVYEAASPVTHVGTHCPPTLILQGEHDVLVKAESVCEMAHKLKVAGVPTIYVEYPQVEHAFDVLLGKINPATRAALYETECFLELV